MLREHYSMGSVSMFTAGREMDGQILQPMEPLVFLNMFSFFHDLGENLQAIGDVAARELHGEMLSENDYYRIQSCLEFKECLDPGRYYPDFMMQA